VTKHDEYRHYAEACLSEARGAVANATRESWLRLAQGWLELIPPDKAQELRTTFEAAVREHGTGQDQSNLSH
jgi:hypothetical protein